MKAKLFKHSKDEELELLLSTLHKIDGEAPKARDYKESEEKCFLARIKGILTAISNREFVDNKPLRRRTKNFIYHMSIMETYLEDRNRYGGLSVHPPKC